MRADEEEEKKETHNTVKYSLPFLIEKDFIMKSQTGWTNTFEKEITFCQDV